MLAMIAESVFSKLVEGVAGKVLGRITDQFEPELHHIATRLDSIEDKVEMQLALHLKAALTFMRIQDMKHARTELVLAVNADPYAAAAHFWFSIILYMEGKRDLAKEEFVKSFMLNPFVGSYPSLTTEMSRTTLPRLQFPSAKWATHLQEQKVMKELPQKRIRSWLNTDTFSFRNSAAIHKASCGGDHTVVLWRMAADFRGSGEYESVLSVLDLSSGSPLWSELVTEREFLFATPTVVVMKITDQRGGFELIDIATRKRTRMSADYFTAVFCPTEPRLQEIKSFTQANVTMSGPEKTWEFVCGSVP